MAWLLVKTSMVMPRPLTRLSAASAGARAAKVSKMLSAMGLEHEVPVVSSGLARDLVSQTRFGGISPGEARSVSFHAFRKKMGV